LQEDEPLDLDSSIKSKFSDCDFLTLSERHLECHYRVKKKTRKCPRKKKEKLLKEFSDLQSIISDWDEKFESRNGYRASHTDKRQDEDLCYIINQQMKVKQKVKDLRENGCESKTKPFITVDHGRGFLTTEELREEMADMFEYEKVDTISLKKSDKNVRLPIRIQQKLKTIPEEEVVNFDFTKFEYDDGNFTLEENEGVFETVEEQEVDDEEEENWHKMCSVQLQIHLKKLKALRRNSEQSIKDFENSFRCRTGKKVTKLERLPLESAYTGLKLGKRKIRLVKALIDKQTCEELQLLNYPFFTNLYSQSNIFSPVFYSGMEDKSDI